ncbi:MAG: hypothetical protein F4122_05250 [Gammaproteobacteria bacterium]|nr:hypothetical protein [Gammaproteobacteria bacterium]MYA35451.1 hypothetical protein [Gammaproteobacteria bacterium]MYH84792.1 hypothetical protein [Gammaproteobacteria bacterium]MYI01929.1 hypothetical protein [Gammaproteobacteria bacterium]
MLRGLAEFVMAGRKQAVLAIVLLGLPPLVNLLTPALVAMVGMRKGMTAGSAMLLWALLPTGFWLLLGDAFPLLLLFGVFVLAAVLRATESWQNVLLAGIGVGAMFEFYLRAQPAMLDLLFEQLELYVRANNLEDVQLDEVREVMTTLLAAFYMALSVALLMLGRSMQAMLYNPGGFQEEFHALRIGQTTTLVLVGMILLVNIVEGLPEAWIFYLAAPFAFAGLALAHALVARKSASVFWLVAMYMLLIFPTMMYLLILVAIVDSWYDFRARVPKSS